jgi:hypothetical protein
MEWIYKDVLHRLDEQKIDHKNKDILIGRNGWSLNGVSIDGLTFSKDEKWVCLPVYDEEGSNMSGGYEYKPQCYKVDSQYATYTGDCLLVATSIYLLER